MNKLTTTALSACLLLCTAGAFAQDAMKKDGMAADPMSKPAMSAQECKDHMAMAAKDPGMKKDDASMKMDAQCADMMKKDDAMKHDNMAKDPMKK